MVVFNAVIIFISYALARLNPPPSLRDTSASGGHEMANSAILTQSLQGEGPGGVKSYLSQLPIFRFFDVLGHEMSPNT